MEPTQVKRAIAARVVRWGKAIVLILVIWGIGASVAKASREFAEQKIEWNGLRWPWLAAAAGWYAVGTLPMGGYWYYLLRRLGQSPHPYETLRAFYIGHLGKYVPGKVMVILLRTGFIRSQRVDSTVAAVSVFVETLTMMATGAFLAALLLITLFPDFRLLQLLAVGLMVATATVTSPFIMRKVIARLKADEPREKIDTLVANLQWRTIGIGWVAAIATWSLLTLSLWSVLRALPLIEDTHLSLVSYARWMSSVTLAVVAGFLSLIPGGICVREWVLDQLMTPQYGQTAAILSALLLRTVWLLPAVAVSIILYGWAPRPSEQVGFRRES